MLKQISYFEKEALIRAAFPKDIICHISGAYTNGDDSDELTIEKSLKQIAFRKQWNIDNPHEVIYEPSGTTYKRPEPELFVLQEIDPDWTLDYYFREEYGQAIFDELTAKHRGQRINFKYTNIDKDINIDIDGTVVELYAPPNKDAKRNKDNYRVLWDDGKIGVVELEEKAITLLN